MSIRQTREWSICIGGIEMIRSIVVTIEVPAKVENESEMNNIYDRLMSTNIFRTVKVETDVNLVIGEIKSGNIHHIDNIVSGATVIMESIVEGVMAERKGSIFARQYSLNLR
jgi:hypothetical protein